MAKLLKVDGTSTEVKPAIGKTFELSELQACVGGTIDMVTLPDDQVIVLNDNGKLEGMVYNAAATKLIVDIAEIDSYGEPGTWSKDLDQERDYLVGDILLCDKTEVN